MGRFATTDMAYYDVEDIIISCRDAMAMYEAGDVSILKGHLYHIANHKVAMKFTPNGNHEEYFSVIGSSYKVLSDEEKNSFRKAHSVHPLHLRCSQLIESVKNLDRTSIRLDMVDIPIERIKAAYGDHVRLHHEDLGSYIIPDGIIELEDITYYLEIKNTNEVNSKKLKFYKTLAKTSSKPFKVLEIDITDIVKSIGTELNKNWDLALINRMFTDNEFRHILDLSEPRIVGTKYNPTYAEYPFGYCDVCHKPLSLCINNLDTGVSKAVLRAPNQTNLKIVSRNVANYKNEFEDGDKSDTGVGLICEHCQAEGERFKTLLCPICLQKGEFSNLKLLYNKNRHTTYLACTHFAVNTLKSADCRDDDKNEHDFNCTLLDSSGHYSKEFWSSKGNFMNFYGEKRKEFLKKLEYENQKSIEAWRKSGGKRGGDE